MAQGSARPMAYGGAALLGAVSLAAAAWSVVLQVQEASLLATLNAAQQAPLPEGLASSGIALPAPRSPLTSAETEAVNAALWRDPLNPRLFNLLYADAVRADLPVPQVQRRAALLSEMGWRYTPAQQNLLVRDVLNNRFDAVVDRVDALLRRQKLPAVAYSLLMAMESLPEVRDEVMAKLRVQSRWRADYLSVMGPQSPPAMLDARVQTLVELMHAPGGISREEMLPSINALAGAGRGWDAYRLWIGRMGRGEMDGLVYDARFRQAAALMGSGGAIAPFEWRFGQDLGYSVQPTPDGVSLNWDHRGVPVFLSQAVPVVPGQRYTLVIGGSAGGTGLGRLLAPVLMCGDQVVPLEDAGTRPGEAIYRSGPLPRQCDMGVLSINGALEAGAGAVEANITHVALRPA